MPVKTNKVHFGIKNVHYAVVTETVTNGVVTSTYGTPVALPGAVGLSLAANQESTNFFADDGTYYVAQSDVTYEGDLEIADIPDQFKKDIFGDAEDTDGALVETVGNPIKYFALLFETTGDAGGHRTVMYKCSATRPDIAGQTKEDSVEVQTQALSITAIARPDINTIDGVDRHAVQSNVKEGAAAYADFLTAVHAPNF